MEIIQDLRNDLFKRQELTLELEAEKNPNFDEIKKQIAEKTKKPEENIDVSNIKGNFGKNKFEINATIYDSKEDLENIKRLQLTAKKRKELAKESTSEENKEPSSTEETPDSKEDKKEEKTEESNTENKEESKEPSENQ
ncbi:hypothetical protein CMI42_04040 [Candidatus Pacearchaeota archaeon]|nr:hypothetical protein [Candidatus Pacearchaeota archaeon]|tara:strand:+ start:1853 stop:2269 length:417 start_codon:yes stop_codon:yes gene_type:complete